MPKLRILILSLSSLACAILAVYMLQHYLAAKPPEQAGLVAESCWFKAESDWPRSTCYRMYVPESRGKENSRLISFPVVRFHNPQPQAGRAPLLHLGAGGPGAAMYLDNDYVVEYTWRESQSLWLEQGRDLFLIDPRGAGLAEPQLSCDTFVKNIIGHLQKNLTTRDMFTATDRDYRDCIERFKAAGVDLGAYNSLAVVRDIEQLRQALGIEQWVLYGVSYAAVYAQVMANEYPDHVAAMILDSPAFLHLKPHHHYIDTALKPYEALYNYCEHSKYCEKPLPNFKARFWSLYEQFNAEPLPIEVLHPYGSASTLPLLLNGNLFVETIFYGLYGTEIFDLLPHIITQLEQGQTDLIAEQLSWYLQFYLLDATYGDVSAMAHECYENIPFTDRALIKQLAQQLPAGYIRDNAVLIANWPDQCDLMGVTPGDKNMATATQTSIPTLFLQGSFDTVTPLRDVLEQRANFKHSRVLTYPLSHGVLGVDDCADEAAAAFLQQPQISQEKLAQVTCVATPEPVQ